MRVFFGRFGKFNFAGVNFFFKAVEVALRFLDISFGCFWDALDVSRIEGRSFDFKELDHVKAKLRFDGI